MKWFNDQNKKNFLGMQKSIDKIILPYAVILIFFTNAALPLQGQTDNTGTTGANFLKIGVDARSLGMAGAAVGMTGNVLSLYWNPATIGFIPHSELGFMHHRYVQDMAHEFAVFTTHISPDWNFALSFSYFNAGTMDKTERTGPGEFMNSGTFSASDFSPIISSAYQFRQNLSVGMSIKPIFEAIDTYHGQTLALDFGGLYAINEFSLGMAVRNVGPGLSLIEDSFDLPLVYSLGASYQFQRIALLAAEVEKPVDNACLTKIGVELTPLKLLSLRGGYVFGPLNHELSGSAGLAAGIGVRVSNFSVDYAFNPMGVLGNSHRVSLIYSFLKKYEPILNVTVQPVKISPDNDGVDDFCTISVNSQFCKPIKKWELKLMDASQNTVKIWKGSGALPEKLVWYGEKNDGELVSPGQYYYLFSVLCRSKPSPLERKGSVLVTVKKRIVRTPKHVVEKKIEKKTFTLGDILFDLNRATIRPENEFLLNKVVDFLRTYPDARVIISGHTDDLAANEYNMQLSLARANAVKNYLLRRTQFDPDNIQTQGFGETQPIAPNDSETNRQKNRRVEISVFYSIERTGSSPVQNSIEPTKATVEKVQKMIDLVKQAALEYDSFFRTSETELERRALENAQRAEDTARAEAEKWGFDLVKKVVKNENSLYELIAGIEALHDNPDWKRMYSAWKGRLVELSELHEGQAVFILYRAETIE